MRDRERERERGPRLSHLQSTGQVRIDGDLIVSIYFFCLVLLDSVEDSKVNHLTTSQCYDSFVE